MSFYCALSLSRCLVLAADNKRRILEFGGRTGSGTAVQPVTLSDAKKIHAVAGGWWMTGVGLADFHRGVRREMAGLADKWAPGKDAVRALLAHLEDGRRVADRWERLAGDPGMDRPAEVEAAFRPANQEVVLARFDAQQGACLVRFCGREGFRTRVYQGPGPILFAGDQEKGEDSGEVSRYLAGLLGRLGDLSAEAVADASWERIPPLFRWLSARRPDHVGATGDLVVLWEKGSRWLLF
ncbi:hypothetical protein SAMN02746041_00133 [Desulfacinum hydrothermale DSM 13146]|uniref:Uncharacterized protein n=1 Tax=Desulfacinum hydrothermale DSM 13146 TaxID=1121390 RepID=A0A1W1WYJ0_9BACT|nr:hypothetical protein [Desulfacinum hydrothermale]SMC16663.1 hypothetical protein SAMN02746041_00133 [Desulfacinum hydrothermale DSM 13146]